MEDLKMIKVTYEEGRFFYVQNFSSLGVPYGNDQVDYAARYNKYQIPTAFQNTVNALKIEKIEYQNVQIVDTPPRRVDDWEWPSCEE